MTSSVRYTVLIEYNWSYSHFVSSLLTFDLCMWTFENCPPLVRKTLCVVVSPDLLLWSRSTFPALTRCFMPTSLHVYGCCFQVTFLEGPLLGTNEDVKPLQCSRYWSVKKLVVHQTPYEVSWELSSPAIHCRSLTSCCMTHTLLSLLYSITWQVGGRGCVQNSKHSYR